MQKRRQAICNSRGNLNVELPETASASQVFFAAILSHFLTSPDFTDCSQPV